MISEAEKKEEKLEVMDGSSIEAMLIKSSSKT